MIHKNCKKKKRTRTPENKDSGIEVESLMHLWDMNLAINKNYGDKGGTKERKREGGCAYHYET